MTKLNWLFTLSSLNVLLITIERFSFTTKILLQPYSFLRFHEIIQITLLILLSIIIPFLIIKELSKNFELARTNKGFLSLLMFVVGVYFYATGNGLHEVASFTFNQYCDVKNFTDQICGGLFFNDYYTGNIYYFIGGILMFVSGLLFEKMNPSKVFSGKNLTILFINSFIYAFTFFAYAAFDRVLVGLFSVIILMIISDLVFFSIRKKWLEYPYITYSAFAYTLATITSLVVRLLR